MIEGGDVLIREGGASGAGFAGLETCGSCWACPVCSAKIAARKAAKLEYVLRWNADRGDTVALATFTIRHHAGHTLAAQWKVFKRAWRRMTNHRTWKQAKGGLFDHYVRAVECTCGQENGWHLHAHVLLLFPSHPDEPVPVVCPDCNDFAADPWFVECETCHSDGVVVADARPKPAGWPRTRGSTNGNWCTRFPTGWKVSSCPGHHPGSEGGTHPALLTVPEVRRDLRPDSDRGEP